MFGSPSSGPYQHVSGTLSTDGRKSVLRVVGSNVGVSVAVAGRVPVGVSVGVAVGPDVAFGVRVGVAVAISVGVRLGVGDGVRVDVNVRVGVGDGVRVGVAVAVGVGVAVGLSTYVTLTPCGPSGIVTVFRVAVLPLLSVPTHPAMRHPTAGKASRVIICCALYRPSLSQFGDRAGLGSGSEPSPLRFRVRM